MSALDQSLRELPISAQISFVIQTLEKARDLNKVLISEASAAIEVCNRLKEMENKICK